MVTTQENRVQMAIDRLASNGPAIVEALRQAGYYNLALQTQHDLESIRTLGTGSASGVEYNLDGEWREEADGE